MAGCPNITGSINAFQDNISGAFSKVNNYGVYGGEATSHCNISFDASRCSAVYGSSETVTPLSESVIMCISY